MLRALNSANDFILNAWHRRALIFELGRRDFLNRHAGSFLGIVWCFIQPLIYIAIMWFVFAVGFKISSVKSGLPYVVWLFSGMIAWNFFSDVLSSTSSVIFEYSYLVKKVNFGLDILPFMKLYSGLIVHICFILLVAIVLIVNGVYPNLYWFQVLYYLFCTMILLVGIGWLTSALSVFIRDINQIVGVILQIGFWITPIFWQLETVPKEYKFVLQFNPMYYIVEGYRNSLLYNVGVWEINWIYTAAFWGISLFLIGLGAYVFKKLRPHFADVV